MVVEMIHLHKDLPSARMSMTKIGTLMKKTAAMISSTPAKRGWYIAALDETRYFGVGMNAMYALNGARRLFAGKITLEELKQLDKAVCHHLAHFGA